MGQIWLRPQFADSWSRVQLATRAPGLPHGSLMPPAVTEGRRLPLQGWSGDLRARANICPQDPFPQPVQSSWILALSEISSQPTPHRDLRIDSCPRLSAVG